VTKSEFKDRNKIGTFNWPELEQNFRPLVDLCFGGGELPRRTKIEAFTILSRSSGSCHCQAHGGYILHHDGVEDERIQALWNFQESSLFDDAERAVFHFSKAAAETPNGVTPEHHASLREHFSDRQIIELMGVVGLSGFLNRYNDSVATVTDKAAADWATEHLGPVGWELGKHKGTAEEQRPDVDPRKMKK
jgi:alkylhydroperoxidase family enzyme